MEIIDGKLTVTNSIAHQSDYHLDFSFSELPRGSARSESSFSDELSRHESDDEARMDVDEESDSGRSDSAPYSSNAREYNHWGNRNDEEIWDHIHEACKTPVSSAASNDGDSDVSEMKRHSEAADNMNDDIND